MAEKKSRKSSIVAPPDIPIAGAAKTDDALESAPVALDVAEATNESTETENAEDFAPATNNEETVAESDSDANQEASDDARIAPDAAAKFWRVQVGEFRGTFGDAFFNDDSVCERISTRTFGALVDCYPQMTLVKVEELPE